MGDGELHWAHGLLGSRVGGDELRSARSVSATPRHDKLRLVSRLELGSEAVAMRYELRK
jgi:hypothetical protein